MEAQRRVAYHVALIVEGRSCLVVGGRERARRKIEGLVDAGALVTVVAPGVDPEVARLAARVERRNYEDGEVGSFALAIAATGIPAVDGAVYRDGERLGVFVNAADDPAHCSFMLPAVYRRGPVSFAVSSDATSPALSVWLRDRLASALPGDLDALISLVTGVRATLSGEGTGTEGLAWRGLIDDLEELLRDGRGPEAAIARADEFVAHARLEAREEPDRADR